MSDTHHREHRGTELLISFNDRLANGIQHFKLSFLCGLRGEKSRKAEYTNEGFIFSDYG